MLSPHPPHRPPPNPSPAFPDSSPGFALSPQPGAARPLARANHSAPLSTWRRETPELSARCSLHLLLPVLSAERASSGRGQGGRQQPATEGDRGAETAVISTITSHLTPPPNTHPLSHPSGEAASGPALCAQGKSPSHEQSVPGGGLLGEARVQK